MKQAGCLVETIRFDSGEARYAKRKGKGAAMSKSGTKGDTIVIKKYANRRLYDTSTSRYVTLDHLRELVKQDAEFVVLDAKSGEDLTRGVLAQIIFEEEANGANMLPLPFLRQLISYYGDALEAVVPNYLQMTMNNFAQEQERLRENFLEAMGSPGAMIQMMEGQTRRNIEMFQQAMRMFTPFPEGMPATGTMPEPEDKPAASGEKSELESLKKELEAMRSKIDKLAGS